MIAHAKTTLSQFFFFLFLVTKVNNEARVHHTNFSFLFFFSPFSSIVRHIPWGFIPCILFLSFFLFASIFFWPPDQLCDQLWLTKTDFFKKGKCEKVIQPSSNTVVCMTGKRPMHLTSTIKKCDSKKKQKTLHEAKKGRWEWCPQTPTTTPPALGTKTILEVKKNARSSI